MMKSGFALYDFQTVKKEKSFIGCFIFDKFVAITLYNLLDACNVTHASYFIYHTTASLQRFL